MRETYLTLCCRCEDVPPGSLACTTARYDERQFTIVYDTRDVVEARHRIGRSILNWMGQDALTKGEAYRFGNHVFMQLVEVST